MTMRMFADDPKQWRPERDDAAVRIRSVDQLAILDTPPEPEFDAVVECARRATGCGIALISFLSARRQWFKAKCGLDADETPIEHSFCAHAIRHRSLFIVRDAAADPRFAANPLVLGEPHIRFYAGVPIRAARGDAHFVGALCVIEDRPRDLSADQAAILMNLATLVEAALCGRDATRMAKALADEHRAIAQRLDRSHRVFQQAERMADIGSWRMSLMGDEIDWSDHVFAIHGLPIGVPPPIERALDFYPPEDRAVIRKAVADAVEHGTKFDCECDFMTAAGELRRVRSLGEIERIDGVASAIVGVFQDITQRYAMEQALRHSAQIDHLTQVPNRARFSEVMDSAIDTARATGVGLALLLIDLDNFKRVNDRCGHARGDELLRSVAARLTPPCLGGSFVARLGGDEFVILVTDPAILTNLRGAIAELLVDLRESVPSEDGPIPVSGTIGACELNDLIAGRRDMLHRADTALYKAKRAGRGSALVFGDGVIIQPAR